MRIICNRCGKTATIKSSSQESGDVKKLYCSCGNPQCGHSFVMDLSFSHTLSPSAMDFPQEFMEKLHSATRMEQQKIFASLSRAS